MTRRGVVVAVPCRDEEERLGECLDAILAARVPEGVMRVVAVGLDRCTDRSAEIARSRGVIAVTGDTDGPIDCVGRARGVAVEAGVAALGMPAQEVWICCTDADSTVPPDWLQVHLDLAESGAGAVRGVVMPDPRDLSAEELAHFWRLHSHVDGHPYVYGAHLGIAGEVYREIGGFEAVGLHEDAHLLQAVERSGRTVCATSLAPVTTSGRLDGRAEGGFAGFLRSMTAAIRQPA